MIKNEREYRITRAQAERFRAALRSFAAENHPVIDRRLRKAQQDALQSQLHDLELELRQYESLLRGRKRLIKTDSFDQLPAALIQARIALGLSQRELAERLGLKEQQIQRYEATNYASASLARVAAVISALGVQIQDQVRLPS